MKTSKREKLQKELDSQKTDLSRNQMGQYATPTAFSDGVVKLGLSYLETDKIRFIDPAFGLGAFYDSLERVAPNLQKSISSATGIEIDKHYFEPSAKLWEESLIDVINDDFTKIKAPNIDAERYNLMVCNPPYVRHHHIKSEEKQRLQRLVYARLGIKPSQLMGLYGYFILLSHQWLNKNGIGVWLVPTEFLDVNYGLAIKYYLANHTSILKVHTFKAEDTQFSDALVTSTVVVFQNAKPDERHTVVFAKGGSLDSPNEEAKIGQAQLDPSQKWSKLASGVLVQKEARLRFGDVFEIKRGIATGSNSFFVISKTKAKQRKIPSEFLRPILPSSRYVDNLVIESQDDGSPVGEKELFLFNCSLPEDILRRDYPDVHAYIEEGRQRGVHEGYICKNRRPWYKQEQRKSPDLFVSYMGRSRAGKSPFRFFINRSKAIATNGYLMIYIKPEYKSLLEDESNGNLQSLVRCLTEEVLINGGRSYGGGLHKLEPSELANIPLQDISIESPQQILAI